jgi:hypothetical protein
VFASTLKLAVASRVDFEEFQLLFTLEIASALFWFVGLQVFISFDDLRCDQNLQVVAVIELEEFIDI